MLFPPPPPPSSQLALSPFFFFNTPPSGVGQQQEAGQAEANRGEPGAPSERGAAEDGVGPTGAHPGGVGPHPYGDWGPYGHERPGKPLEAEAEIPGEISSSALPPHYSLHCIDYPALSNPTPIHPPTYRSPPTPHRPLPYQAPVSSTSTSSTTTVPLFPVLICPCVFLYLLVEWGELAGRWRKVCSSTQQH